MAEQDRVAALEHGGFAAGRSDGKVSLPLPSRAGARDVRYGLLGTTRSWTGRRSREHGFWIRP
ncbi:MAG: hypothetical protein NZ555_07615 [Geminicoccaceae bacterium]|nr:hypothetical protein [Geminicoccaceae bacterium]MCX8100047.1 hypothetical protein [Geminicoccaceae bacterium]MDW8369241.1 hypothetical protein [Geminicoccaceae bacterium]